LQLATAWRAGSRAMSQTLVVASGFFNPLHYGHVSYLQKAREQGDSLVVIVNNDEQQAAAKRKGRMEFDRFRMPARDRVRLVRALACVDAVFEAIDKDESVCKTLRLLHPDVFANGGKKHATEAEVTVCRELGIQIVEGLGIDMLMLKPFTQHYDWGKPRGASAVAALTGEDTVVSPTETKPKPFAELWMGDHPSGPSRILTPQGSQVECLASTLKRTPSILGQKLSEAAQLPFLLKVLSIHKALSIQAHPDRSLAAKLHAERPDVYKDPNHKPEIAIAVSSDFEALCGFRPVSQLVDLVEAIPELREMVGEEAAKGLRDSLGAPAKESSALKVAYSTMMRRPEQEAKTLVKKLAERAAAKSKDMRSNVLETAYELVTRLHSQFGEDIGVFSVFFLNYVRMGIGECLYMPQNTPHAYLAGDIVECMACSDNVVRGGLTPKFKDIEVLCEMLEYVGGKPPCIRPLQVEPGVLLYQDAALEEFQVTHVQLSPGRTKTSCFSGQGPALGFAWKGSGSVKISGETTELAPGVVFLLGAGVDADFKATDHLHIFVACCPPQYFKNKATK